MSRNPGHLNPRPVRAASILAWAVLDGSGTPRVTDGYNVSSVSDDGAGLWTVTWSQAISASTAYALMGMTRRENSANPIAGIGTRLGVYATTTSVAIQAIEMSGDGAADVDYISLIAVGSP